MIRKGLIYCSMVLLSLDAFSQAGTFVSTPVDARSISLGNTYITQNSMHPVYANPAASVFGVNGSIAMSYNPWVDNYFSGQQLFAVSGMFMTTKVDGFVLGYRLNTLPSYDLTDAYGNVEGEYTPKEFSVDFGYVHKINQTTALSLSLHSIHVNYGESLQDHTLGFDLGMKSAIGRFDYGLMVRNIGKKLTFEGSDSSLPFTFAGGLSTYAFENSVHKMNGSVDVAYQTYSDVSGVSVGTGLEYLYKSLFRLQVGYYYADEDIGYSRFSAGAGVLFHGINVDFAWFEPEFSKSNNYSITLGYCF